MTPELESAIAHFEAAWQAGEMPTVATALRVAQARLDAARLRELAVELVKLDLEYRWRSARSRGRTTALRLESYAGRLPLLGPAAELPVDLIAEEYRVRRRFGDAPDREEYAARFLHPRAEIFAALETVDRELTDEALAIAAPRQPRPRRLPPVLDPQAPLYFGDYVLRRQIGVGGLCRVYAGLQLSLRKEVAIKVLRRRYWNSPDAVSHFLREAKIVAQLPREGIVGIHGLGRLPQGGYFMVMDLVDGLDLRYRRMSGGIELKLAIEWVAEAAAIVARVHSAGFVHGDVKPANILVEYDGRVLLTDFGFAQPLDASSPTALGGIIGGTPAFMAPELDCDVVGAPNPATDVFGLGGVLFWLLSGQPIHDTGDAAAIPSRPASATWEARVEARLRENVPVDLREMCQACLARDPHARPLSNVLTDRLRLIEAQC